MKFTADQMKPIFLSEIHTAAIFGVGAAILFSLLLKVAKKKIAALLARKPFDDLPMPKGNQFLFSNPRSMDDETLERMTKTLLTTSNKQGRLGFWVFHKPALVLTQWQDARTVLLHESARNPNPIIKKMVSSFAGPNMILLLNGREWKTHRAGVSLAFFLDARTPSLRHCLSPASLFVIQIVKSFTPECLNKSHRVILDVVDTVSKSLKQRVRQNGGHYGCQIEPISKMITLDAFGLFAMSHDFGSCRTLEPSIQAKAFEFINDDVNFRLSDGPLKPANYFHCIPTERNRMANNQTKILRSFIEKAVEEHKNADGKNNDLLTNLMKDHEQSLSQLTDTLVAALFAGYDTTSITLTYALHEVSRNPDIEAKMLEEIASMPSLDNLDNLVYTKAVVQETLRLHAAAPIVARDSTKPITLADGFVIPAGTGVVIPVWTVHRNEANFPRPDEFLPERWVKRQGANGPWVEREADDTSSDVPAGNPKALFAFSQGGRNCAGMKFALQEAILVLAGLVKDFRFEIHPDYKLQPKRFPLIQAPHDKLPMKISIREEETSTSSP